MRLLPAAVESADHAALLTHCFPLRSFSERPSPVNVRNSDDKGDEEAREELLLMLLVRMLRRIHCT